MPETQRLFDEPLQALQQHRRSAAPHPLYTEATTRLAERLEDVARDFARVGVWEASQSQEIFHPATPKLRRTSCESTSPSSLRATSWERGNPVPNAPPITQVVLRDWIAASAKPPPRNDDGESSAYDLITSCLTLQNANDLQGELAAIHGALADGGLFLGVLAGGQTLHELRTCLMESEIALTGGASPRTHPLPDLVTMGRLLGAAGFALPVVDSERLTLAYPNLATLMQDLRAYACTNALTERSRRFAPRALFTKTQELYATRFPAPSGGIAVTVELVFLHGWKEAPP